MSRAAGTRIALQAGPAPCDAGALLATEIGAASGGLAVAAAVGVALAAGGRRVLIAELGAERGRGPTTLASGPARDLERSLRERGFRRAAARGRLCWLGLPGGEEGLPELARALQAASAPISVVHVPAGLWRRALDEPGVPLRSGLLRADLAEARALTALAVIELRERHLPVRVASRPLGLVASRRALAGLEVGGGAAKRVARLARGLFPRPRTTDAQRGQALPLTLGAALAVVFVAAVLAALGGATTGAARVQRAADLAALSGARSLRDDLPRLLSPARLANGAPNPRHLDKGEYLARAAAVAREAARRNGVGPDRLEVSFPDLSSFAPVRVRTKVAASIHPSVAAGGRATSERSRAPHAGVRVASRAEAEAAPPTPAGLPATASGGGYSGPLAYRQGKPMRPDVAVAFDRLAVAARRAGLAVVINSAYRSDAEQARLFSQHPDPRWVAPPGQSLHRCATELDLGPATAFAWLSAHAPRFGFVRRYSWEPWHFGYGRGPAPCSAAGNAGGMPDGGVGRTGLQDFVPGRFREPILRAASRWNVSAGLLAAQLMAESNFNPFAVSAAGARGIAQFMPATARAYGLRDPFEAPAAIDAQAHLMSDLLRQFGSVSLALAAYNAGPAPVAACRCVPQIPETRAYVVRILGLMGGAGELAPPVLEVRLVD
jgi:hypothetical protein